MQLKAIQSSSYMRICPSLPYVPLQVQQTPLHLAAWGGRDATCHALLEAGAEVNPTNRVSRSKVEKAVAMIVKIRHVSMSSSVCSNRGSYVNSWPII